MSFCVVNCFFTEYLKQTYFYYKVSYHKPKNKQTNKKVDDGDGGLLR